MSETCIRPRKRVFVLCLLVFTGFFCQAGQGLDKTKYITVEEIRPGMEAYCLTVYKGTEIEKFDLEVLDVVRNAMTGRDAILVQGTDERFVHTGPVAGCSGSPVYIDGRLAGALAFGFFFSKDPLYGATPIEEMLRVGESSTRATQHMGTRGFSCDFSKPLDFAEIDEQIRIARLPNSNSLAGATPLPCPLVTSGLPTQVVEQLDSFVKPYGFMAVAGISGGNIVSPAPAAGTGTTELVSGACLAVPLITGDITADVVGTVTEVVGDKVYGFGHSFLGYGAIDLPMATGQVHTVVSSMFRSFKFASADEIVGALTTDESTAIYGQIGAKAK
ncbi:MAG: SpoIVB peptidase S55 domain-containing protein, partial [Planctomycetota bacterium]